MSRLKIGGICALFCGISLAFATAGEVTIGYNTMEIEPNDTRNSAGWLISNQGVAPSFWMDADRDYYKVIVSTIPTTITVHVDGVPGNDPATQIEDVNGGILAQNDDKAPGDPNCFLEFSFTTTGTYYVVVFHSFITPYDPSATGYSLYGEFIQLDDEPPTYSGPVGIRSVERNGFGSALVEWAPAQDNFTPPEAMKYNIYWSTKLSDLFTPPPGATAVGTTSTTVSSLDPHLNYYFGVRAEDTQGNEETNEVHIFAPARLAVNPSLWSLYR